MKILFLDVDGVLNSRDWAERHGLGWNHRFDPQALQQLERVIATTGAYIVVSSSWRIFGWRSKVIDAFADGGMSRELRQRCIDATPSLPNQLDGSHPRGREIDAWLKDSLPTFERRLGSLEAFAIVDDADDMCEHKPRLAQTDWSNGLTSDDADRLIALLNEAPRELIA